MIPVENATIGVVSEGAAALAAFPALVRADETVVRVCLCLLAPPGSEARGLRRVHSQPVALAQCGRFLAQHPWIEPVAAHDTAGAAREVASRGDTTVGAIASRPAAERYGLAVLAEDIADVPRNYTRFVAVTR